MTNIVDRAYAKRKARIDQGRFRKSNGGPVEVHRWTAAREVACKATGVELIELYVGQKGSTRRTHEIAPAYNRDCGIERQIAYNDRLDRAACRVPVE